LGKQLRREGICVNDKRIRRIQRKYQLFPIRWQSFKIATTDSNHGRPVYPNLLAELTVTGINQVWVADIAYIRLWGTYPRRSTRWQCNQLKLPIMLPSILAKKSPAGGAQSRPV